MIEGIGSGFEEDRKIIFFVPAPAGDGDELRHRARQMLDILRLNVAVEHFAAAFRDRPEIAGIGGIHNGAPERAVGLRQPGGRIGKTNRFAVDNPLQPGDSAGRTGRRKVIRIHQVSFLPTASNTRITGRESIRSRYADQPSDVASRVSIQASGMIG